MKQGRASSNVYEPKTEPIPHRVNVITVGRLGEIIGTHTEEGEVPNRTPPIEQGRGFSSPRDVSVEHHKSGSQGRR